MAETDVIVDEACRRILWDLYGLDNYSQAVYYELSSNKDEYRTEYNQLKHEFLGPYFRETDNFRASLCEPSETII